MYRKIMHRTTTDAVLVIAVMCVLAACGSDRTDTFTSPNGTNTIRIVYDEASRPSLFYHDEKYGSTRIVVLTKRHILIP